MADALERTSGTQDHSNDDADPQDDMRDQSQQNEVPAEISKKSIKSGRQRGVTIVVFVVLPAHAIRRVKTCDWTLTARTCP